MDRNEIIQRLKNISEHAVHTTGKQRYIMSLDDGIALCEAAEMLEKESSVIDSVLEIIKVRKQSLAYDNSKDYRLACDDIESLVLALKGGEQE